MRLTFPFFALLIVAVMPVFAQYKQHAPLEDYYRRMGTGNERIWQRIQIGIGKHFIPGTINFDYKGTDTLGKSIQVSDQRKTRTKNSIALHAGTFFPITLISDRSMLVFTVEAMVSHGDLTFDSVVFAPKRVYYGAEEITMAGGAIGLDYKNGGEVSLSKYDKVMFSIGGGLNICGYTNYLDVDKTPLKALPFIKAELGFFAGIAFKLRGTAYIGDANFIDRDTYNVIHGDLADLLHSKSNTGFGYTFSLIILPISYNWKEN